jgi:xylulokinase
MKTVLGIDCGTQSTKVLVYDPETKKVIARGQAPHDLISSDDGTREQKTDWWIAALKKALSSIPKEVMQSVGAVGVSGQQHGFVPVDEEGKSLHAVKLWCDTSTVKECQEITDAFGGPQKLLKDVGNLILPGYTASKIRWFKKNNPAAYQKMKTVLLPHDFLNFYLTGKKTMEYGDASGTALLNIRDRKWDEEVIKKVDDSRDLSSCLPDLIEPAKAAGTVIESRAKELGLPSGSLVSSGGGDNMMGAIGTGTNRDGVIAMSLGTSGTLYGYSEKPLVDPDGNLAAFCSSTGGWLPLLCTMNCTVATELTRALLQMDLNKMEQTASQTKPGSDGVITLPFFNGERTPNLPRGRGCVMGLTNSNYSQANLLRSAMESGLFGLRLGLESFTKLGFKAKEIRLIGGGAKSALWRQMAADIFNLPTVCPQEEEAAAFGAALQALWCANSQNGSKKDLNEVLNEHVRLSDNKKHTPNASNVKAYQKAYATYKSYVNAVSPLFK